MYIIKLQKQKQENVQPQSNLNASESLEFTRQSVTYSQPFKQMMTKVLNRINTRTNFYKKRPISFSEGLKGRSHSMDFDNNSDDETGGLAFSDKDITIKQYTTNRLSRGQNVFANCSEQKPTQQQMCIHNKTSVSFLNNKIYRKNLQKRKFRSLSSEIKAQKMSSSSFPYQQKQNLSETRYKKRAPSKIVIGHSLNQTMKPLDEYYCQKQQSFREKMFFPKGKAFGSTKQISEFKNLAKDKKLINRQKFNVKCNNNLCINKSNKSQFEPWNSKQNEFQDMSASIVDRLTPSSLRENENS